MALRSTGDYSLLSDISTKLDTLSDLAKDTSIADVEQKLDEMDMELKKIRTGHELHLWDETVDEPREE